MMATRTRQRRRRCRGLLCRGQSLQAQTQAREPRQCLKSGMTSDTSPSTKTTVTAAVTGLFTGSDQGTRCAWCQATPLYRHYHDTEWGFPVADDRRLFEKICLEGFQAGLSWLTILNKRGAFRGAFAHFEAEQVARFDARDVQRLLGDAGIVRHAGKIASTINNARRVIELRREFGSLATFVWRLEPDATSRPERITLDAVQFRYPGNVATKQDARDALRDCRAIRKEVRASLGLPVK